MTTQKEEGLAETPQSEELFLQSLMEFTRSAKHSMVPTVAEAARRWEGILAFRIEITRQERRRSTPSKQRGNTNRTSLIRPHGREANGGNSTPPATASR